MAKKGADAAGSEYTLIIPAYNEEKRIGMVLEGLTGAGGQFIFIFDGNDQTPDIINDFSARHPEIRIELTRHEKRQGKGKAIMEGFRMAVTPVVGFMDADGSTGIEDMEQLIARINGADGVIGSRWLPGSDLPTPQGLSRRIQSRTFNWFIRYFFGLSFKDTQCGAKVFKKSVIDAVIDDMVSAGFEFDVELLWRICNKGYIIEEYPIRWENVGDSKVRRSDVTGMFTRLLKLRFRG